MNNELKGATPTLEERKRQKTINERLERENERNANNHRPQAVRNPVALKYGHHQHVKLRREEV